MRNALRLLPFPLDREDAEDWLYKLYDQRVFNMFNELKNYDRSLVATRYYYVEIEIVLDDYTIVVNLDENYDKALPIAAVAMKTDGQHFLDSRTNDVLKWAEKHISLHDEISAACKTFSKIVTKCTTTGQIARVLPEELVAKLPYGTQRSLAGAERMSRWPQRLSLIDGELDHLSKMVATASLVTNKPDGNDVDIRKVYIKEQK
jgi:hypothetical protein